MARTVIVPDSHIYSQADRRVQRPVVYQICHAGENINFMGGPSRGRTDRPGYISRSGGNQAWRIVFNVVFFVVLTSAVIQGTTISPLTQMLSLVEKDKVKAPTLLELMALGKTDSEINHILVDGEMPIVGKEIQRLNLPDDILFTAIIREKRIITPKGSTVIEAGDTLYVMNPKQKRKEMKTILGLS